MLKQLGGGLENFIEDDESINNAEYIKLHRSERSERKKSKKHIL